MVPPLFHSFLQNKFCANVSLSSLDRPSPICLVYFDYLPKSIVGRETKIYTIVVCPPPPGAFHPFSKINQAIITILVYMEYWWLNGDSSPQQFLHYKTKHTMTLAAVTVYCFYYYNYLQIKLFKKGELLTKGWIAQLVEHLYVNLEVLGSSLALVNLSLFTPN